MDTSKNFDDLVLTYMGLYARFYIFYTFPPPRLRSDVYRALNAVHDHLKKFISEGVSHLQAEKDKGKFPASPYSSRRWNYTR